MPGSLCLTHLRTWWSCVQFIKRWVFQHLKVKENAFPRSDSRAVVMSVRKSSESEFCLTCASAAKRPWWSPGDFCGSLTPPSGAHSLSDSDPGCTWDSGVWRARWRLHQPATKKAEAGKDELIFTVHSHWRVCKMVVLFVFQRRRLCALHYPALTVLPEETANVSGAGDRCYNSTSSTSFFLYCFAQRFYLTSICT